MNSKIYIKINSYSLIPYSLSKRITVYAFQINTAKPKFPHSALLKEILERILLSTD